MESKSSTTAASRAKRRQTDAAASRTLSDAPMAAQHRKVWRAIDQVAASQGLSPSSLAKLAGLDATAFNPSKRIARDGRLRWPGVETLAKVSEAAGVSLREIVGLIEGGGAETRYLPLARLVAAKADADAAFRVEDADREQAPFAVDDTEAFFLDLTTPAPPVYRAGDRLIVSPSAPLQVGARVAAAMESGEAVIGALADKDKTTLKIAPLAGGEATPLARADCAWIGRIIWASQ